MTLDEAKKEGQRWLDYLEHQKEKSIEIQKLAGMARRKEIDAAEARNRMARIDDRCSLTVYDGSKLAEAVALLISS